jgi:putative phosphoribosyl transferase
MTQENINYKDREEATYDLLQNMPIETMKKDDWIVVSTSINGLSVASVIAKELNDAKVDILLTSKIFAPQNSECAIAIVSETKELVINEELVKAFDIDKEYIYQMAEKNLQDDILQFSSLHKPKGYKLDYNTKNILFVDEGVNTNLTLMVSIKTAIKLGAKSISVAVPLVPDAIVEDIEQVVDDFYYAKKIYHFTTIDAYYDEFEDLNFKEIKNILEKIKIKKG